jgi:hypothetical protein
MIEFQDCFLKRHDSSAVYLILLQKLLHILVKLLLCLYEIQSMGTVACEVSISIFSSCSL